MKINNLTKILLAIMLIFSSQFSGIQYSYSSTIALPGNIVVRASQNADYLNGTLTVSWDVVSGATAYAVMATRTGTSTYSSISVSGERNTQAVLAGLAGGVTYIVQVRAIQDVNASAWSSNTLTAVPITLPKAVGKPSVVAGIGSATVTWVSLVDNENGGSSITSYVAREINSGTSVSVAATESTARFTDLEQGSTATFKVIAISDVSATGSMSVASDEVTILSAEDVSPDAGASPTASARPSSPVEVTVAPSSGGSGGGSSGGGVIFGGGGGGAAPSAIPSPPNTASPIPTASPSPSTFIPAEKTPLQPSISPSPKPAISPTRGTSPSPRATGTASARNVKNYLATTTSKANLTTFTAPVRNSSLIIKSTKNLSVTLPVLKKGTKIVSKVRTPNGAVFTLATITVKKAGSVKLPTIDFKKPGTYQLVTFINGKSSTLKITVKK
jgi:hypothetical protein